MNNLKHTWHHIRRSPFQSMTATAIMTLSLFLLSTYAIVSIGMSSLLKHFETKPEVTIFLKDGIDQLTIDGIRKELSEFPSIREVKYISKEKALSIYKEQNKDNPLLTEMVTASILPASFEVSVSDPNVLEEISQKFSSKATIVDEIIYQKDIIKSILSWTNIIRKIGIAAIVITSLISFFIISIIIGMKITNRKDEIKVSRMLGASRSYVKKPFITEGLIYGAFGSVLGSGTSILFFTFFAKKINDFFQPVVFISSNPLMYLTIFAGTLAVGAFVGYFASSFGAKRYIKF